MRLLEVDVLNSLMKGILATNLFLNFIIFTILTNRKN